MEKSIDACSIIYVIILVLKEQFPNNHKLKSFDYDGSIGENYLVEKKKIYKKKKK